MKTIFARRPKMKQVLLTRFTTLNRTVRQICRQANISLGSLNFENVYRWFLQIMMNIWLARSCVWIERSN